MHTYTHICSHWPGLPQLAMVHTAWAARKPLKSVSAISLHVKCTHTALNVINSIQSSFHYQFTMNKR